MIWAVSVTAIQFVLALGLALLLSQPLHGRWLARSLALVPWAMPSVIVAIMWRLIYQPQAGVLNEMLRRGHLPGATSTGSPTSRWALPAVILVGVWAGMPQTTIALLAGVQSIQDELHEAAAVDGATAWQRFRTITLPQLRPVIIAITTLDFIWNFNSFGLVWVLTQGGLADDGVPGAVRLQRGLQVRRVRLRLGARRRDGRRDRVSSSSSTSGAA